MQNVIEKYFPSCHLQHFGVYPSKFYLLMPSVHMHARTHTYTHTQTQITNHAHSIHTLHMPQSLYTPHLCACTHTHTYMAFKNTFCNYFFTSHLNSRVQYLKYRLWRRTVLIQALPFATCVTLSNLLSLSLSDISYRAVERLLNQNTHGELITVTEKSLNKCSINVLVSKCLIND